MTKTALITGASRGLGAALAQELCDSHHIIAVAKTTGALEELDDRIQARGGSATLAPMDITNNDAMATLCRGIYDRWGNLDLWLHTAIHAAPLAPSDHIDGKDMAKSVATNITATSTLITYIAPLLGHSGQAVFFDDPVVGTSFYGSYGATKADADRNPCPLSSRRRSRCAEQPTIASRCNSGTIKRSYGVKNPLSDAATLPRSHPSLIKAQRGIYAHSNHQ